MLTGDRMYIIWGPRVLTLMSICVGFDRLVVVVSQVMYNRDPRTVLVYLTLTLYANDDDETMWADSIVNGNV